MRPCDGWALDDDSYILVRRLSEHAEDPGGFQYGYAILSQDHELIAVGTHLRIGVGSRRGPAAALEALCSLLREFAEAQGRPGAENADLFPADVAEWARDHSGELARVELELRELSRQ